MKKKILIASVLKPINDARMYEKIAISLSRVPEYEVHVAGFAGELNPASGIQIHPLFSFQRLSWKRFMAPWKFYKLLIKVKPQYTIVTTHELLIVTCIHKILFGGKILYDVQENYFRNIAFTGTFPPGIRHLLAIGIRLQEVLSRPLISHYFLAEKNYEKEFGFSKGKSTVLENKTRKSLATKTGPIPITDRIKLLYSGTIAEIYGVFEAIDLAIQLHASDPRIELRIVGFSAKKELLDEVLERIKPHDFIQLIGGNSLVPHEEILREISSAHFGLISYRSNKSTINCIPTKVYEYLAFRLPMIVQNNPIWRDLVIPYQAGIMIDYTNPDLALIHSAMNKSTFYKGNPPEGIYWEEEEMKLLKVLESI